MNMFDRRRFLQAALASLGAAGYGASVLAAQQESPNGLPTRPLGKTGQRVSIIGLGGFHIGTCEEKEAIAIMHEAIDEGLTFFDNSWDYHMGGSEEKMGKALSTGGRRDKVFLMTKCCARDYKTARQHLEDSLRRLRTDVIDLWQYHEINWDIDAEWLFDRGAVRCALEARREGKVRFIGFTGHKDYSHMLKTLQRQYQWEGKPFHWDTVQMPLNLLDAHYRPFQKHLLPEAVKREVAVIGMKGLSGGLLPEKLGVPAELCRQFVLSLPIASLICGIRSRKDLRQDIAIARNFKPLTQERIDELLAQTKQPGDTGKYELYKTTRYGSEYHFKQHGE